MTWAPERPPCGPEGRHRLPTGEAAGTCPCGMVRRVPVAIPRPRSYVIDAAGTRHPVAAGR